MSRKAISLVDTAYHFSVDCWAVFTDIDRNFLPEERSRFWNFLRPGFQHVEIWKFIPPGAWIRMDGSIEMVNVEVYAHPPWILQKRLNPTCVKVNKLVKGGKWREPFFFGPVTCVELAKAFLGIRNFFVRTPFQLYNSLREQK